MNQHPLRFRLRNLATLVLLAALWVVLSAQAPPKVTGIFVAAPSPSGGDGCYGACVAQTSFTVAQVGSSERTGFSCGGGFGNMQTSDGFTVTNHGATSGVCDQVLTASNYSGGAGGMGFRHYRYSGVGGGGIKMFMASAVDDVQLSFRMKYSSGFTWAGDDPSYTKDIYGSHINIFGFQGGGIGYNIGGGTNRPACGVPTPTLPCSSPVLTWSDVNGGVTGDGVYHCYEMRWNFTADTAETWFDGVKVQDETSVPWGASDDFIDFFTSNQNNPDSVSPAWTDYDDFLLDSGAPTGYMMGCQGL